MKRLLIITGPTGSGKTALSLKCAEFYDGEIISADSMQVYKYMDIGTAKITKEEMRGIPHHLIDVASPLDNFNTYDYRQLALAAVEDIQNRGKTPIIVGGTGLYVDSILYEMSFLSRDEELRRSLTAEAEEYGAEFMHEKLKELNPAAYEKLHPNDLRRVIRALEIALSGGHEADNLQEEVFPYFMLTLNGDRQKLYERIEHRVDVMLESGLEEEVKRILAMGVTRDRTCMQAIAYKEMAAYFDGEYDMERCIELIKQRSRNYAKRQLNWFRKYRSITGDFEKSEDLFEIVKENYGE